MNGSPAISSLNRVQRWQSTQRSRSSSTWVLIRIGLAKVRLVSVNRLLAWPLAIAWFCSGHSPPLSQTGQSSGWLISSSSITPRCAFSATGEVIWVRTTMPAPTSRVQEACGFGIGRNVPSGPCVATSTRHCRQAPAGASNGWSQNRGMATPSSSAARITRVPLGTLTSTSSMVRVIRSGAVAGGAATPAADGPAATVIRCSLPRRRWRSPGRTGSHPR